MRRLASLMMAAFLCWASLPALAVQPDEILADPVLEGRARAISSGLRCLVCQNQSIDDSAAPLAKDLRILVRDRLKAGDSDAAVKDYLVARYGDFILLEPPFKTTTLLLWLTPALALLLGGFAVLRRSRSLQALETANAGLDDDERARLDALLKAGDATG